ncbi:MAG: hypothetical protein ACRDIX_08880 [Actinomycetota bacterium]
MGKVPPKAEEAPSQTQDLASFDGWSIRVSVEPGVAGPIALAVGPLRAAPKNDARLWLQHELEFHNRGDRPVRFEDTRTSVFLRRSGRPALLVADEGCGYGKHRRKPVEPGVCTLNLDAFVVRPGSTARRTVTLFKDLRGMAPLAPGSYVWDKVIRFRVGRADAPVRTATIRLTYELVPLGE